MNDRAALPRVLVVDDDADLRDALCELFRAAGFEVDCAPDGGAALAALHEHPLPDVVFLDWMMPGVSGAEFRRRQLADPAIAAVPVVVITASRNVRPDELRGAERMLKPLDVERLFQLAETHAAARRAANDNSVGRRAV